jgi:hypothetical protein
MDVDHPSELQASGRLYHSPLDGQGLKRMVEAGLIWLRVNQQTVNSLNVFPVPDGDTGTNMVLTMQAAYSEIADSHEANAGKVAHAIAHGALMGARGNSGVILSQLWRGFARALDSQEYLDGPSLVRALAAGRDTAYKGVVRPVEGTILTVAKDVAAAAEQTLKQTNDFFTILSELIPAADRSVQHTPELLPVLKEAGVVDSGGKGLYYILEGMHRFSAGLPLEGAQVVIQPLSTMKIEETLQSIEPGQDFEVVVDFYPAMPLNLERFYADLEQMGTSIQVGEGDGMYRMHIHVPTEKRYAPIDYTMGLGTITKVAMENLLAQMEQQNAEETSQKLAPPAIEPGQIAVVTVAPGPGIARVFASLGVAAIVEGGQTMNPSTQEIFQAFENLPTNKIILLPNNKNIILAAQASAQAAAQKLPEKSVMIVPSRTVPQGLAAMLRLIPHGDLDEVAAEMKAALEEVETGEITTATRSVEIDGVAVTEGQIIALHNGKLILGTDTIQEACLKLLAAAETEKRELITLFSGANLKAEEVERIAAAIRAAYPGQEVEIQEGGQPHYHFIISIE